MGQRYPIGTSIFGVFTRWLDRDVIANTRHGPRCNLRLGDAHHPYYAGDRCRALCFQMDATRFLKVEVFDIQRVFLDELAPWFDNVTHQFGKQVVGFGQVFDPYLQQRACVWIQRGFP